MWLGIGAHRNLSRRALSIARKDQLMLSPMAILELQFLWEIGRLRVSAQDLVRKLQSEMDLRMSDLAFNDVANVAAGESWTRDPFDRIIVAHARLDGVAPLISADDHVRANYIRSIW